MKILQFDKVSKVFYTKTQQTTALHDVSFSVEEGQFVAIIGPSGCGKTTILSLVCGLIQPTSGKVVFSQENSVGYMLQRDQLFEWRTIWKNVLLGPEIKGNVAQRKPVVEQLLKKYGLWEFRNHYPTELSGGMRQRAALIRTLGNKPRPVAFGRTVFRIGLSDTSGSVRRRVHNNQKGKQNGGACYARYFRSHFHGRHNRRAYKTPRNGAYGAQHQSSTHSDALKTQGKPRFCQTV